MAVNLAGLDLSDMASTQTVTLTIDRSGAPVQRSGSYPTARDKGC